MKAKVTYLQSPIRTSFSHYNYNSSYQIYLPSSFHALYSSLGSTHTYKTDTMHMLLDHTNLYPRPCGGEESGLGMRLKPCMPCMFMTLISVALYTCLWYNLDPELE